jgi:hypothetical protein
MDEQRKGEWLRILAEELAPLCAAADGFRFLYFADWAEHPTDRYLAVTGWDTMERPEAFFASGYVQDVESPPCARVQGHLPG